MILGSRTALFMFGMMIYSVHADTANHVAIAHAEANVAVVYGTEVGNEHEIALGQQTTANAAQDLGKCAHHFYGRTPPVFVGDRGQKLARENYELCFDGFAVLYSGVSRTPIYSAAHLTKARIDMARTLSRSDSFHEESRLPANVQATLEDYRRSGYDRGHLAPNGDMANASQQFDSFSLANIAPQNNEHNRGVWQSIEKEVRHLTLKHGDVYVVTGVAFLGSKVAQIGKGVLVPTHFFKAVYVPRLNRAGVYYAPNNATGELEYLSLAELTARTGIDAMPHVSAQVQSAPFGLPSLSDDVRHDKEGGEGQDGFWLMMAKAVVTFVMKLLT